MRQCRGRNLFFSSDTTKHLAEADMIFVRCAYTQHCLTNNHTFFVALQREVTRAGKPPVVIKLPCCS